MICKICQKEFDSARGLHSHISRTHSIKQSEYYHKFYPKIDKFDGSLVSFKNFEQYFETDFNSRENFVQWFLQNDCNEVRNYCLDRLYSRLKTKKTSLLPSQVELKSLFIPSISGFEKIFGGMDNFLKAISKKSIHSRFIYDMEPTSGRERHPFFIYEDTREQTPLKLSCEVRKMKLSVGDYTISEPYFSDVFVERKSINDLVGTLSSGLERFEKEIQRARQLNGYIVVLVEGLFSEVYNYAPKTRFQQKVTGSFIMNKIRHIMSSYLNIQFVFGGNETECSDLLVKILKMGHEAKKYDLEFLKDKGYFNVDRRKAYFIQGQSAIVG